MLNHSGAISQGYGRVSCPDDGLRILARLIARDLVTKRQDNTSKKNDKKVGTSDAAWSNPHSTLYGKG